ADLFAFALWVFLELDLREESGEVVILVLGPALEGMVMAFVAVEASGQKKVGRVLHRLGRRADYLPITGGGMLAIGTGSSEDLASELIVRRILLDLLANPGAETFCALGAQKLAVALEEIGPFVGPEVHVFRAADQAIHDCVAFGFGVGLVLDESVDLF